MKAKIIKAERRGENILATILLSPAPELAEKLLKLLGRDISVDIKQLKEKRSLDANAYFWVLVGKLADKLNAAKEEIYIEQLRKYGQCFIVTVGADVDISKITKYYDLLKEGELNGKQVAAYKVYVGSSEYDTAQMSVLINGTVEDCKDLDIDTLTPAEIAELEGIK